MRYGSTFHIVKQAGSPITQVAVKKTRDYHDYVNETIHEKRVQIIKIQDFDTLVSQMHIEHALQDHGAFVEHRDGKMYAVLTWIEKN